MKKTENNCVGCTALGFRCIGRGCPNREVEVYRCDKCGWEPADPKNPPKFCMECGDPFTDDDIK